MDPEESPASGEAAAAAQTTTTATAQIPREGELMAILAAISQNNERLGKMYARLEAVESQPHTPSVRYKHLGPKVPSTSGKLSSGKTWCLLRHLIDPLSSKTATNRNLTKVLNTYKVDGHRLLEDLKAKYLKTAKGQYPVSERNERPDNEELERQFTMTELWRAIDDSKKRSAPGRDAITYKLLGNMSRTAARGLLEHINEAWESLRLTKEWKDAEVRFIPKPGKALTIDNMRPISFTSCCVGKVVERMVLRRLQKHLEETDQMPEKMYGFRQHLSTQDIMIQLHGLVLKPATRHAPRGTLALDLKEAFDSASHESVLQSLNKTRLLDMGAHNTVEKLIEAHFSNQIIWLSHTEQGRAVLRKTG
ncbi:uncharacterized protein LOC144118181 [Amblyomma americanum]